MKNVRFVLVPAALVIALVSFVSIGTAQQKMYQLSPAASVSQTAGVTDISVTYHCPGVKGREIWGKLVPYDQVWRAGANEATTVSFSTDVTVGGKQLKAGTYGFFVIPKHGQWIAIFNAQPKQWGAFSYDSTKDVVRVPVTPETIPNQERLSYIFADMTPTSIKLVLQWEKVALPVTIDLNTGANLAKAAKDAISMTWQEYNNYALFCLDSKIDWDKGMEAVDKSIAIDENASNLRMKAELLAQGGKTKEAIETAEKAIAVGKAASPRFNASEIQDLIDGWKK
ncbi:MAG TPA: DUF2911 domain-containing protein [Bacteroidota bacterium]|nr:DUF2911 domain-containing protein [Bacteroidota bacterium]